MGKATLLLCFIHGFKGDEETFYRFPDDLKTSIKLTEPPPDFAVETRVYPKYETRGDLAACVETFKEWLRDKVIEIERDHGNTNPVFDPSVSVVLVAHSMGGFLAADALFSILGSRPVSQNPKEKAIFPLVHGVLLFDVPLNGLSRSMFAYGAFSQYQNLSSAYKLVSALTPASLSSSAGGAAVGAAQASSYGRWGALAARTGAYGAIVAGGVAAWTYREEIQEQWRNMPPINRETLAQIKYRENLANGYTYVKDNGVAYVRGTYVSRESIGEGFAWMAGHLKFVGALMKTNSLNGRLERIEELEGIGMANFYTTLGDNGAWSGGYFIPKRTFCAVPVPGVKNILDGEVKTDALSGSWFGGSKKVDGKAEAEGRKDDGEGMKKSWLGGSAANKESEGEDGEKELKKSWFGGIGTKTVTDEKSGDEATENVKKSGWLPTSIPYVGSKKTEEPDETSTSNENASIETAEKGTAEEQKKSGWLPTSIPYMISKKIETKDEESPEQRPGNDVTEQQVGEQKKSGWLPSIPTYAATKVDETGGNEEENKTEGANLAKSWLSYIPSVYATKPVDKATREENKRIETKSEKQEGASTGSGGWLSMVTPKSLSRSKVEETATVADDAGGKAPEQSETTPVAEEAPAEDTKVEELSVEQQPVEESSSSDNTALDRPSLEASEEQAPAEAATDTSAKDSAHQEQTLGKTRRERAEPTLAESRDAETKTEQPKAAETKTAEKSKPWKESIWIEQPNPRASNEIEAHCSMFRREKNVEYKEMVEKSRVLVLKWMAHDPRKVKDEYVPSREQLHRTKSESHLWDDDGKVLDGGFAGQGSIGERLAGGAVDKIVPGGEGEGPDQEVDESQLQAILSHRDMPLPEGGGVDDSALEEAIEIPLPVDEEVSEGKGILGVAHGSILEKATEVPLPKLL